MWTLGNGHMITTTAAAELAAVLTAAQAAVDQLSATSPSERATARPQVREGGRTVNVL